MLERRLSQRDTSAASYSHYTCVEAAPGVLGVFIGASLAVVTAPIGVIQQRDLAVMLGSYGRGAEAHGERRG